MVRKKMVLIFPLPFLNTAISLGDTEKRTLCPTGLNPTVYGFRTLYTVIQKHH